MLRSTIRTARAALVLTAVLMLVLPGCGKKKEEARRDARTAPNVTIQNYSMAPDVELKALDGTVDRLTSFRGKIVILCFLNTVDAECKEQVATLNKLAGLQTKQFALLAVFKDPGEKGAVEKFVKNNPVNFPVYYNGQEVAGPFGGVRVVPTTYFILRNGSIYRKDIGVRSLKRLNDRVREMRGQRL